MPGPTYLLKTCKNSDFEVPEILPGSDFCNTVPPVPVVVELVGWNGGQRC
jgi:hypothetical protein